ncbi:type II toxin-antitoxin system VapC family toxin [Mesorhizobium sp. CN2-181]|uniref:type II toxin-antitoxin system VapC family toxin n=1 Tax=Mesorhizobium yinganensis TaxID=3157707 RepID=UPI0032B70513
MFVDASALTVLMTVEDGSHHLFAKVERAGTRLTSPLAVWEAAVAVSRTTGLEIEQAGHEVDDYLTLAKIDLVPIPAEAAELALGAFDRYGKGRHPARLNMGDCFAYARARHFAQPLLYKDDDFAQTDIETA